MILRIPGHAIDILVLQFKLILVFIGHISWNKISAIFKFIISM